MRIRLLPGIIFVFGITMGTSDAAYLIRLKNGNDYVTNRYWHEGSQVFFETYGGVFGIDKNFVAHIAKTEEVIRVATLSSRAPADKLQQENKEIQDRSKEQTIIANRDVNDPIRGEFNRLKAQAAEVDGMLTAEIVELLNQITSFKNKLSKDSKLFVQYGREFNDAHDLANIVETTLRSRNQ